MISQCDSGDILERTDIRNVLSATLKTFLTSVRSRRDKADQCVVVSCERAIVTRSPTFWRCLATA